MELKESKAEVLASSNPGPGKNLLLIMRMPGNGRDLSGNLGEAVSKGEGSAEMRYAARAVLLHVLLSIVASLFSTTR